MLSSIQLPWQSGTLYLQEEALDDILQQLIDESEPTPGTFSLHCSREGEERHFKHEPVAVTTNFERNRKRVEDQLKTITDFLWKYFNLPTSGIIEYGPGATGYFDSQLKPTYVGKVLQIEINPHAISENLRRNPDACIAQGSYYDYPISHVSMVSGLCSFDTAQDMPRAIDHVADVLAPGGYFLHIQDVRPGTLCILRYLERKYRDIPQYGFIHQNILMGLQVGQRRVTVTELFRQNIGDAILHHDSFDPILNHYVTLVRPMQGSFVEKYFLNYYSLGLMLGSDDPGMSKTTVLVTLARKKK